MAVSSFYTITLLAALVLHVNSQVAKPECDVKVQDLPDCAEYTDACTSSRKMLCQRYCGLCSSPGVSTPPTRIPVAFVASTSCVDKGKAVLCTAYKTKGFCGRPNAKGLCDKTCGFCTEQTSSANPTFIPSTTTRKLSKTTISKITTESATTKPTLTSATPTTAAPETTTSLPSTLPVSTTIPVVTTPKTSMVIPTTTSPTSTQPTTKLSTNAPSPTSTSKPFTKPPQWNSAVKVYNGSDNALLVKIVAVGNLSVATVDKIEAEVKELLQKMSPSITEVKVWDEEDDKASSDGSPVTVVTLEAEFSSSTDLERVLDELNNSSSTFQSDLNENLKNTTGYNGLFGGELLSNTGVVSTNTTRKIETTTKVMTTTGHIKSTQTSRNQTTTVSAGNTSASITTPPSANASTTGSPPTKAPHWKSAVRVYNGSGDTLLVKVAAVGKLSVTAIDTIEAEVGQLLKYKFPSVIKVEEVDAEDSKAKSDGSPVTVVTLEAKFSPSTDLEKVLDELNNGSSTFQSDLNENLKNTTGYNGLFGGELLSNTGVVLPSAGTTSTPFKTTPSKTSPAKTSPTKISPSKDSPAKTSPTKISPSKASPTKTSPSKPSRTKASPIKVSPTKMISQTPESTTTMTGSTTTDSSIEATSTTAKPSWASAIKVEKNGDNKVQIEIAAMGFLKRDLLDDLKSAVARFLKNKNPSISGVEEVDVEDAQTESEEEITVLTVTLQTSSDADSQTEAFLSQICNATSEFPSQLNTYLSNQKMNGFAGLYDGKIQKSPEASSDAQENKPSWAETYWYIIFAIGLAVLCVIGIIVIAKTNANIHKKDRLELQRDPEDLASTKI